MTSPAKDIQEHLEANDHGTSGVDLFYHKIPGEKQGIAIRDTGGFDTDKYLDKSEGISRPTIQIFARGEKYLYDEIYSRLYDVVDFLDQTHEITINSKRYISIFKAGDILDLGENTSEQPELSVNFYIQLVVLIPSLISATIPPSGATISLLFSEAVSIGSNGSSGWTLNAPTTAMTYASGDGTDTLIYDLASVISSSAAPTTSYDQPGNGIENSMKKDLESIVEGTVINNSTQTSILFENDFTGDPLGPYSTINSDFIAPGLTVESIIFGDTILGVITADGYTAQSPDLAGICFVPSGNPSSIVTNFSFSDTNSYWIFHKLDISANEGMGVRFRGTALGITITAANYPGVMDDQIITGAPATWIDKQITCETTLTGSTLDVSVTYESSVIYTNTVTLPIEGDDQAALLIESDGAVQYFSLA